MGARAIHAAAATERLRGEDPPWGIDLRESICEGCSLAYWTESGSWGICPDCGAQTSLLDLV